MSSRPKSKSAQTSVEPNNRQRVFGSLLDVPLLGSVAFSRLSRELSSGDSRAAVLLARKLDRVASPRMRQKITAALEHTSRPASVDLLWQEWMRSRSASLENILLSINQAASKPPETRAFSLLKLGRIRQLEEAPADLVMPLIQATTDADEQLARTARQAIGNLQKEDALEILCAHWALTRNPLLEATILKAGYLAHHSMYVYVLTALKLNQPNEIPAGSAPTVDPLIRASRDKDEEIARRADFFLRHALSGAALNEFCLRWSQTRDADLEEILLHSCLVPRQPPPLRLLCALKVGNQEIAQNCPPRFVEFLLNACQDPDSTIQQNASMALRNLRGKESQEAICQLFLVQGNSQARQIAMDAGYLPASPENRALFLFLTEQWQAYETLDFDHRILRATYEAASPELRQRMARTIQSSGRIEFLNILTGSGERLREGQMEESEADLVIQMLAKNQNWSRLWQLAFDLTLRQSVEIVRMLNAHRWSPSQPEELRLFQQLSNYARQSLAVSAQELVDTLPPGVPLATLKIRGRVNDVAFSPDQSLLALATGSRKVVLWDYQKGQVRQVLTGFAHSVGQIAFLANGTLVCAERTTGNNTCNIIGFDGQNHFRIGHHASSITALIPLSDCTLLTAGRDQRVTIWDVTQRRKIKEILVDDWPRCAAISPDGQFAALITDRIRLLKLENLELINNLPPILTRGQPGNRGMSRAAIFTSDNADLLTGQINGQVIHFTGITADTRRHKRLLEKHAGPVVGICFIPKRPYLLTGGGNGELHFLAWPSGSLHSKIPTNLPNLSSLEISPNGDFLATGFGDNAFTLWDLRTLDLPALVEVPISRYQPDHLAAIESLAQVKQLSPESRNTLGYLTSLLQYRYRFDIQISELNHIQPGEFDILLNEFPDDSGYNGDRGSSTGM